MFTKRTQISLLSYSVLALFFYLLTFLPSANALPKGIHQWAQADRVAICMRYIDGKSLTDAATLSVRTTDGNTGVEFSGFQYVLAQVVRLGFPQSHLPLLYRFTTFFLLFTSLFLLVYEVLKRENILYQGFVFTLTLSSPLLLYYGYNFLPDVLALSLLLWALYLFHKDYERNIYYILLISGLALLIKTSSGIYCISFMAVYFLKYWNKWNLKLILSGGLFLAIGTAVAYYDYTFVHLRNATYNSYVFLSTTMPTQSWDEFIQIFDTASRFKNEYFTLAQRMVMLILIIIGITQIKKINRKNPTLQLTILVCLGLLSIILLFGVQYMNHDYYVIATFFPIVIYLFIKSIAFVSERLHPRTSLVIGGVLAIISFSMANQRYFNRMSEVVWINNYPEYYEHKWLEDAEQKIKPFVPNDAYIFSVYSPEPNFALVHLNRKGATFNTEEMKRKQSPFTHFLRYLNAEYVVCYSRFTGWFAEDHPNFIENASILYSDDNFTLYKKNGRRTP